MSYEGQTTLKEMIEDLNLEGILKVLDIMREHPEVVSIDIKTKNQAIAEVKGEC